MATVSARIKCEIEVEVGRWDGKSTFNDLREQVRREGTQIVQNMFQHREIRETPRGVLVPGTVVVKFVTVCEEGGE